MIVDVAPGCAAEVDSAVWRRGAGERCARSDEVRHRGEPLHDPKRLSPPRRSPPRARSAPPTLSVLHMPRRISRPARLRHV